MLIITLWLFSADSIVSLASKCYSLVGFSSYMIVLLIWQGSQSVGTIFIHTITLIASEHFFGGRWRGFCETWGWKRHQTPAHYLELKQHQEMAACFFQQSRRRLGSVLFATTRVFIACVLLCSLHRKAALMKRMIGVVTQSFNVIHTCTDDFVYLGILLLDTLRSMALFITGITIYLGWSR